MSIRRIVRSASVLAAASVLAMGAPSVHGVTLISSAYGASGYPKPPVVAHADRVPSVPGSTSPRIAIPVPSAPAPAVPRVDGSGAGSTHPLAPAEQLISGGSGTNKISFASFASGDIVVVLDPLSITGHAGVFDRRFYASIKSFAVISANVSPVNGVQKEQCLKYRLSDRAYGLWVPKEADHSIAARNLAYKQMGKPYNILGAKTDLSSFYCSKLAWVGWRYTSGLDLDGDGGYWVWPVDLINSPHTSVFGYWS